MKKPLFLSLIQIRFGNVACGAIVLQNLMTSNGPNHEDLVFLKRLDDRWNFLEVLVYQCLNLYRCKAPPAPGMLDGVFTRRSKTSVDSENYEVRRFVNIFTSPHTFILIASLCRVGRRAVRRFWQYERVDSTRTLLQRSLWWNRLYCTLLTHVRGQYVLGSSRPLQLSVYCWFLSCEHLKKLAFIHIVSKGFFLCEASRIFIVQSCTFSAYFWRFYTANNPFPPDFRYLNTCMPVCL